jgi:hypothetical protein
MLIARPLKAKRYRITKSRLVKDQICQRLAFENPPALNLDYIHRQVNLDRSHAGICKRLKKTATGTKISRVAIVSIEVFDTAVL